MSRALRKNTVRLNKFIADAGVCSRRKADELIKAGKVKVDGNLAVQFGTKIDLDKDKVKVIVGKSVRLLDSLKDKVVDDKKIYIALNKPRGYVCSNRKFKGEKSIFELVSVQKRLFSVGRLDKDSEGLLILTNDGDFAERFMHPRFQHEKEYLVWIDKDISKDEIKKIEKGVSEGGEVLRVKLVKKLGKGQLSIVLTEGKKRHIRRIFKALGFRVGKLQRIRVHRWELGNLEAGKWRHIDKNG